MSNRSVYVTRVSLLVALGGFLMGFDSAVISGVVDPVKDVFRLDSDRIGWAVACLTLGATIAMGISGPLADRFGRRPMLMLTAVLFTGSALGCAVAPDYDTLVVARIIGGFGVGGALIIAPMYIAEIAPPEKRGQLVSFNQLNIVLGYSVAFFSNYFLNEAGMSWRTMLGVEAIPAGLYLLALFSVPRSPRWLLARGREGEALAVLEKVNDPAVAAKELREVKASLAAAQGQRHGLGDIFNRRMRRVMVIGLGLGFFQQISGINAIFYYSTTIFGMAGAARDVALGQAIYVGLVNVVFTLIAMYLIDRLGRKPLLMIGTSVMALALFTNGAAFSSATYSVNETVKVEMAKTFSAEAVASAGELSGQVFDDRQGFLDAVRARIVPHGEEQRQIFKKAAEDVAKWGLEINGLLVLVAILLYIAAFAISLGPVMWAMFSEIFPQHLRGIAISTAGFFNSGVSFLVQKLFPRGLETLGPEIVFYFFAVMATLAFLFSLFIVPETKGRSLEELEELLAVK